ncbi:MAG: glycosyltransferase family protein, partial [Paracoccaceae bacterium]
MSQSASHPSERIQGTVQGTVETLHKNSVYGWVWTPGAPLERATVELLAGDTVIGTAVADQPRKDLKKARIGDGAYGFQIPLPKDTTAQPPYAVRLQGTDTYLTTSKPKEWWRGPQPSPAGTGNANALLRTITCVDGDGDHLVFDLDWTAIKPSTQLRFLVRCGAEVIANKTFTAPDVTDSPQRVTLDLAAHTALTLDGLQVQVIVPPLESARTIYLPHALGTRPVASLDVQSGTIVTGWVTPLADGTARRVRLMCDGVCVWEGAAMRAHSDSTNNGFSAVLDMPENTTPRTLTLEDADVGGALILPRTVDISQRFRGRIDGCILTGDTLDIHGWAQDCARPYDPIEVTFVADGVVLSTAMANQFRIDLQMAQIGVGVHAYAFSIPAPEGMAPGQMIHAVIGDIDLTLAKRRVVQGAEAEATQDAPPQPTIDELRKATVEGRVERVAMGSIAGWARYKECPHTPVLLDLYVNGSYYQTTLARQNRPDVAAHFKDTGLYGYLFELSHSLATAGSLDITVRPRYGISAMPTAAQHLNMQPDAVMCGPQPKHSGQACISPSLPAPQTIAYIVINLNGAAMLEDLFHSFERTNRHAAYDLIIVDHGSEDGSLELCEAWKSRLNLTLLARGQNHSFSASNNYGVQHTNADVVVFLNNDIVLAHDITPGLLAPFADPDVGMVGMKLYDRRPEGALERSPIQHLGVHFNDYKRSQPIAAFETRYAPQLEYIAEDMWDVPAVTGAIMACRRTEFEDLGGFDEGYFYGLEDVDLCLKYRLHRSQKIICNNQIGAYHVRAYSRSQQKSEGQAQRQRQNHALLQENFGSLMRRVVAQDRFTRPGFWSTHVPVIAFAVTEATMETAAGDYFTALDLARQLELQGDVQVVFLDKGKNWFDLSGIDVLVTMRDDYDLRKIQNAAPHLLRVGWARNWIARWGQRPWSEDYDLVWASSETSAKHLSQALARNVEVVRIATDPARFEAGTFDPTLKSDYCFTGSFFNAPREIVYNLVPDKIPYTFGLYGHGWDRVPQFAPFARGPLPYTRMPDVYASTRIVIDDANSATKEWGSVNSRVFDAIAGGALVVTNGVIGAKEVFGDLLPTYSNLQELEALLHEFLGNEDHRKARVSALQEVLHKSETYTHRAAQAKAALIRNSATQMRFAIKIGAPRAAVQNEWGDYHYAVGLRRALTQMGHSVRIDCLDTWEGAHCMGDDVVIVLRGLSHYKVKPHQINVMWNISHPDIVSRAEYESYDHVFIASLSKAEKLSQELTTPVTALLQCSDPERFHIDHGSHSFDGDAPRLLFVGNSRNEYRTMVRDCVAQNLPVDVYGSRWDQFLSSDHLKGTHIPNEELSAYYSKAQAVLNDHWDDMREQGFISNRIFDAAASGAYIIT